MDLQQALRGLDRAADDTVGGIVPPPAGDLWRRGERWQRRRRRGTAAVAALGVVVLAALSLVTVQRATPPEPAVSPGSAPTLPDRVYDVSPWLPVAMPGEPVVAAQHTVRATWTGDAPAIAVLTGSGRYLHLDAPDLSEPSNGEVALAPDGRHLAYWATGTPSGSPQTSNGQIVPVTGVVVVDLVTGTMRRHDFATAHGISPDGLLWADDDTLLGGHSQALTGDDGSPMRQGAYRSDPSWTWDVLGEAGPTDLTGVAIDSFSEAGGDRLLTGRWLRDLTTGGVRKLPWWRTTGSVGVSGANAYLRSDGVLAQLGGTGSSDAVPNRVTVADLTVGRVDLRGVPDSADTWQVLGWRDDDHLLVARERGTDLVAQAFDLVAVDTATGEREVVVRGGSQMLSWAWATDLLGAPVVPGVEPASPADPRVVAGAAGTVVVLTLGGLVLWRRRGHP